MNFNKINQSYKIENFTLRPISLQDREFISHAFKDSKIKLNYVIPKEAGKDPRGLVNYWLKDVSNAAGCCWVIERKGGFFSGTKPCGFVSFEFRDSLQNARLNCAILPNFRREGIATQALNKIIEKLKIAGVERVEADIDRNNVLGEKLAEKIGFSGNRKKALIDPIKFDQKEFRFRVLWKKELIEVNDSDLFNRVPIDADKNAIEEELNNLQGTIERKGKHPQLIMRYAYLLGRLEFLQDNLEKAKELLGQCNLIAMDNDFPEIHETYFWFAKINEESGDLEGAKMYYNFAIENYNENPSYISKDEIEKEMNKDVINYNDLDFYVVTSNDISRLITNQTSFRIWEEKVSEGHNFSISYFGNMRETGRYHFLFQTNVTEKMVGVSENDFNTFNIPWELLREEKVGNKTFMIFCGWGDPMNGGHLQFNYHEIGIPKPKLESLSRQLISTYPDTFSITKMKNVIGMENFDF